MTEPRVQTEVPVPEWIATDQQLNDACIRWSSADFLAVDTEFVRTSTFYPKPGLIQVADKHACVLIDPLAINDWSKFKALMQSPDVVKVFHSCAEDLEVCKRIFDAVPSPLFDTQIAMALSGYGGSVGFQRAVSELLDLDIPKEATRTDWLQRPLTPVQMEYATADVFYLFQIYPRLKQKLESLRREAWVEEECERLVVAASQPDTDFSGAFQRVKSGWKLRPQEQVLQQLAVWREEGRALAMSREIKWRMIRRFGICPDLKHVTAISFSKQGCGQISSKSVANRFCRLFSRHRLTILMNGQSCCSGRSLLMAVT